MKLRSEIDSESTTKHIPTIAEMYRILKPMQFFFWSQDNYFKLLLDFLD